MRSIRIIIKICDLTEAVIFAADLSEISLHSFYRYNSQVTFFATDSNSLAVFCCH